MTSNAMIARMAAMCMCVLAVATTSQAVNINMTKFMEDLDATVKAGMACKKVPGLAIAIIKDGKTVLATKGYGVKDLDTGAPVTADTLFQIASLTKAFTVETLVAEVIPYLGLDKHYARCRPYDPCIIATLRDPLLLGSQFRLNDSMRTQLTTVEDILAHKTGIPRNNFIRLANDFSIDTLPQRLPYLPAKGAFRDSWYYNDLMYGLAAHLAEKVTNKTWQELVQTRLFDRNQMDDSTFVGDVDFATADVASPYVLEAGKLQKASIDFIKKWGRNTGSGTIFSSANDMAKWMKDLLYRGMYSDETSIMFKPSIAIPQPSYAAAWRRPQMPASFSGDNYGLGWKLGYYRGYQMDYHSGSTFGYSAYMTLLSESKIGVVTLMSGVDSGYRLRTALHEHVMDVLLGYEPFINASTVCGFPYGPWTPMADSKQTANTDDVVLTARQEIVDEEDVMKPKRRSASAANARRTEGERLRRAPLNMAAYAGTYKHLAYGDIKATLNASTGDLELVYGIGAWRLTPTDVNGRNFQGAWTKDYPKLDMDFQFGLDGDRVTSVEASDFDHSVPPLFLRTDSPAEDPVVG